MPNAQVIIDRLSRSATLMEPLALAWHAVFALVLLSLVLGSWTPSKRRVVQVLSAPLFSVALIAVYGHDVFNGFVFMLLACVTVLAGTQLPTERVVRADASVTVLACAVLAYAWVYPHFVATSPWWRYALATPLGVLPCPTLAAVLGLILLGRGFGSPRWSAAIAVVGLFYGAFGVLGLHVWLDLGLVAAALTSLAVTVVGARNARPQHAEGGAEETNADELTLIREFLAVPRMALIGVSSDPNHFSRVMMRALIDAGIDVVPVHPNADVIEGARVFSSVDAVQPPLVAALIMTPAEKSAVVMEQCAAAKVERVWLHRGVGRGAVSQAAVEVAQHNHLSLVCGRCPLMFLGEPVAGIHRVHAELVRLAGHYPRQLPLV